MTPTEVISTPECRDAVEALSSIMLRELRSVDAGVSMVACFAVFVALCKEIECDPEDEIDGLLDVLGGVEC